MGGGGRWEDGRGRAAVTAARPRLACASDQPAQSGLTLRVWLSALHTDALPP